MLNRICMSMNIWRATNSPQISLINFFYEFNIIQQRAILQEHPVADFRHNKPSYA